MSNLALVIGNTYYRVTYADRDLTMPGVEPLVYIGDGTGETGEPFHAFQDTVSYVRYGSRFAPGSTERDDLLVYFLPSSEIGVDVVDLRRVQSLSKTALSVQLQQGGQFSPSCVTGGPPPPNNSFKPMPLRGTA
ncbi:hypothetical protein H9L17_04800 [Thermomonas brevis]|uniref:Uncharacterized protein n=1 Tax=Thermomonas brevis TaxID=215691 RepID=A0A7G9QVT5_9GAMM|nr:hypothetical protein [Thermomonas brevis]QNN47460.1 hypothetical protein H9L17_04800 [Thermomonas brevis]